MKKQIIIGLLMIMSAMSGLYAQDTIDTNYYRYDYNSPTNVFYGNPAIVDGIVNACPNGVGFNEYNYWRFRDETYASLYDLENNIPLASGTSVRRNRDNGYITIVYDRGPVHMYYQLGSARQTVHGIAFAIDEFFQLTEGDSITAVLCTLSSDRTRFIDLDSITIKGGETGKRRWMEIPMLRGDAHTATFPENGPYDNCIDTVRYCQMLEFYFNDRSYTIEDDFLFWKLRVSDSNGSVFCVPYLEYILGYVPFVQIDDGEIVSYNGLGSWSFLFPILSPLPEWEEPSVCQIVPDAQKPNTPDNPQDPDDPDDPDNPGGDEGIGEVDGGLQSAVSLRPNPSSEVTTVSCAEAISELTVRDMAGRTVLRKAACGTTDTFDTSTFRKGVYLVKVTTARGTVTKKLVVEP